MSVVGYIENHECHGFLYPMLSITLSQPNETFPAHTSLSTDLIMTRKTNGAQHGAMRREATIRLHDSSTTPKNVHRGFFGAMIVMWKAWELRNNEVHDSSYQAPTDIVQWSAEYLECYRSAQIKLAIAQGATAQTSLQPPPANYIKINIDVGNPGTDQDSWSRG